MKRKAVGIWSCKACKKTIAGGAWTVSTTAAATVRRCVVGALVFLNLLNPAQSQYSSSSTRNHGGLDPSMFSSSFFYRACSYVVTKYKANTARYVYTCGLIYFPASGEKGVSLPNQRFEYQFDSPSARIREFLPPQRFTLKICTPARLCLNILCMFCCRTCGADRFNQVPP